MATRKQYLDAVALRREQAGLPPDPASDAIWADRLLAGEANFHQVIRRLEQKAATTPSAPGEPVKVATRPTGGGESSASEPEAVAEGADLESARARLTELLNSYGLGSLSDWAWNMLLDGHSEITILQELRGRPEYKQRFPAMDELRSKGRAINEGQYIELERGYTRVARNYGLPTGFYDDPTDFAGFISNEMSTVELENRLRQWKLVAEEKAADPANASVLQEMDRLYGVGADTGEWLALVIDPGKALPAIERQVEASRIGATSRNVGFGSLSRDEAERLAGATDVDGAREGLSTLARSRELMSALPGQERAERTFSRRDQFGAVFDGDTDTLSAIDRQARRRTAEFEGGGSFASSREGLSGLGRSR